MSAYSYQQFDKRNGDTYYHAFHNGERVAGYIRDSLTRGDNFHAVITVKGKTKSRYYGTKQGAAGWLRKQEAKR